MPAITAARRMGMTETEFMRLLPSLLARGFPGADPTTGNFDLDAIDEWRKRRHQGFTTGARDARTVAAERLRSGTWAR